MKNKGGIPIDYKKVDLFQEIKVTSHADSDGKGERERSNLSFRQEYL
jgi:hypothetical protein